MSAPAGSPHPAAGARMPPKLGGAVSGLAPPQQNGEAGGRDAAWGLGRREGRRESGRAGGLRGDSGRAGPGRGGRGGAPRPRWSPEAAVRQGERPSGRQGGAAGRLPSRPALPRGRRPERRGRRPAGPSALTWAPAGCPGRPFGLRELAGRRGRRVRGLRKARSSLGTWWIASFRPQERSFDFYFF